MYMEPGVFLPLFFPSGHLSMHEGMDMLADLLSLLQERTDLPSLV